MKKKHYLVYKTTCLVNGKIYIGQHQTYNPNDNYLGSGRDLKDDIQKFGRENFKREILFDFDTQKEMDDKEKELVTEEFIFHEDTYNVRVGGQNPDMADICRLGGLKVALRYRTDIEFKERLLKKKRMIMRRAWKEHPERYKNCFTESFRLSFLGKHHTEETKQKLREKAHLCKGKDNGSFGTVWIYNESLKKSMKVRKELVDDFLSEGWKLGRKTCFH